MAQLQANGIGIEYEEFGSKGDPAMILVGGWSVQLTFWPKPFIDKLVASGLRVIVFDNRDVGLSKKMKWFPPTNPLAVHVILARLLKSKRLTAYTLEDMAEDVRGILDTLKIEEAHVLGLSMGGMITQIFAAKHPERVKTATILMSTTNRFGLPRPSLRLSSAILFGGRRRNATTSLERRKNIWRTIRTQNGGYDEKNFDQALSATIDRSYAPAGRRRQLEAVFATGDLRRWTRAIKARTLVIHGSADPLALPHGGLDIAANIENSRFELIPGMGHDLAPNKIDLIAKMIIEHTREAPEDEREAASKLRVVTSA